MKKLLIKRRIPRIKVTTIHNLSYHKDCIKLKHVSEIPIIKVIRPVLFSFSDFIIQSEIDFVMDLNKIITDRNRKKKK
tara:strand:+ start:176 stop:409 length:234 start_codon:yes stop_codon:yes gene_type:complete